ncbi:hypothetical protein OGAPHI_004593 [Ogataea philodendri]|uniref:Uncharacterized protein n=1 Tax=Ogataea philodendri TaxID=1378263 RepID=A0A9P8P398_9ASCO|nr:uncharacterized protein OGAPHI_004593 [Ogataea philodendri]KAH3664241.1 hypothetical protein OGAPHI_004593 [Ogataea philodendri]
MFVLLAFHGRNPAREIRVVDCLVESGLVRHEHGCCTVAAENDTAHHHRVHTLDVSFVGQTRVNVVCSLEIVDRGVEMRRFGRVEDLKDIKLSSAGSPSRTVGVGSILRSTWDVRVQKPDGWHVVVFHVLVVGVVLWSQKLEQEHLGCTVVSMESRNTVSVNTTVLAEAGLSARDVRHDHKLVSGLDGDVAEHRALCSLRNTVRVDII